MTKYQPTFLTVFQFNLYVLTFLQLVSSNSIEIDALERVAQLGEFYDARNDQFLHLNLFQNVLPNSSIISTRNQDTRLKYTLENTYEEKFKVLDISVEQQLSILGGLIKLKGCYFKDRKSSAKSATAFLVRSFSTIYEQVSILDSALQPSINFKILPQIDATHVVIGIQWGGHVVLVIEDENQRNDDIQKVRDNVGLLAAKIAACGDIHNAETQKSNVTHLNYEIYGDLVPENAPQTLSEALQFMETSHHIVEANNDKGKAVKYVLLPLDSLQKLWNIKTEVRTLMANRIDATTVKDCVRLFDMLKITHKELEEVESDAYKFKNHMESEKLNERHVLIFKMLHSGVTADISQHINKVRSGQDVTALSNWYRKYEGVVSRFQELIGTLLRDIKQEIAFLELLQRDGVILYNKHNHNTKKCSSGLKEVQQVLLDQYKKAHSRDTT